MACGFIQHILHRICYPVACLAVVGLNSAILDYYLIKCKHLSDFDWYDIMWIIADILVLCLFLVAFIKAYPYYKHNREKSLPAPSLPPSTGLQWFTRDLPLSYISWLVFSVVMSTKVWVIYALPNSIVSRLKEQNIFGPNTLHLGISLVAVVYKLLVDAHRDVGMDLEQKTFYERNVDGVYLDLLDTTQFLDNFGDGLNVTVRYDDFGECDNVTGRYDDFGEDVNVTGRYDDFGEDVNATVKYVHLYKISQAITCVNYILPTAVLYFLAYSRFGISMQEERYQHIHMTSYFLIVNVPMFIIRIIMWLKHNQEVSVFIVKNIMVIVRYSNEVYKLFFEVSDCDKKKRTEAVQGTENNQPSIRVSESEELVEEGNRSVSASARDPHVKTSMDKNSAIAYSRPASDIETVDEENGSSGVTIRGASAGPDHGDGKEQSSKTPAI